AINPQAPVYTLPCVASYVGGDIVSGVLATKMHRNPEVALFMDIGTNGELAIGNNEWLMTAACSAGPCFEGSGIRCGMRATPGAIEAVRIDPVTHDPQITIIGGGTPLGICGSGMIDAISEMYLTRTIDQRGKFIEGITDRIIKGDEGLEYVLYHDERHGRDIVLSEVDIENVLRAKAAIYAGIVTMLGEIGFTIDAVDTIYVAGGFGNYINVERAITLGMLPDIPKERYKFMGNTSVTGAYLTLLSEDLRREADEIAQKMTYLELSVSRNFMDQFLSALFLPHTDMSQFPTVAGLMNTEHEQ
ncbi:MAG TPA: ASKHA domain-containing protein, partial [Dissulfurispiraceae bacterium]|nr:ASKHA domain-containing protein [Dissulfurispiraceae bacterium]